MARWPRRGDLLAGKYRIESELGRGGMGVVFSAVHVDTEKRVAIKWLAPEHDAEGRSLERFRREARAAGRIHHPNVVTVFDIGEDAGGVFLVMEYLHGASLADMLEGGTFASDEAVGLVLEALRGIAAAHKAGVIHRDLKPENLFAVRDDEGVVQTVKVLDFGVSKTLGDDGLKVTRTGTVIGTPYYMAPEQVMAADDLDGRVDVYSMGVVLYELLAGRPPYEAESYNQLVVKIATEPPLPLRSIASHVDPGLCAVVETAMARERSERFRDVVSFAEALEPFAGGRSFRSTGLELTGPFRVSAPPRPRDSAVEGMATLMAPTGDREARSLATSVVRAADRQAYRRNFGVAAALVLLVAGAVAWALLGDDGAAPPRLAAPPTEPPAAPGASGSHAGGSVEAERPPDEGRATQPAAGAGGAAPIQAPSGEPTPEGSLASPEGRAASTAELPAQAAGATTAPPPQSTPAARRRPRRARRRTRVQSPGAPRGPRAGSLSLDDF